MPLPVVTRFLRPAPSRPQAEPQAEQEDKKDRKRQKQERKAAEEKEGKQNPDSKDGKEEKDGATAKPAAGRSLPFDEATFTSDRQTKDGDLYLYEGYVNITAGNYRIQADRITYNEVTSDVVAEGNVIFDEGEDQRVTARRAELNLSAGRGTFWETTGFTNRTQTSEYIYFVAERVVKTGPGTYELFEAQITACEDVVPKWSFRSKRAELEMGNRLLLNGAIFRVKDVPVFVLPYAWIPSTRTGRKSGFLLPQTGSSNQKGRTFKTAYYQTLGQSADITFRNDIYTSRGLGFGAEFRAQTDEKSYMRLGIFTVKDRLFGPEGENQGGSAFVGEGIQYLPHGWLAVFNVSVVSSLRFRQAFSDDISQVIDPRRESNLYVNNNTGNFSFNLLTSNETTRLFRPNRLTPDPETVAATAALGTDYDVRIRQAPQIDLTMYPHRLLNRPIYFSFDASVGALKREETINGNIVSITPSAVQRFDFAPKLTLPLATFAGIAVTPSLTLRSTYYSSSIEPTLPAFDPERFAASPDDPRLNPALPEYNPAVTLFDRALSDRIIPEDILRNYAEFTIDIRPPAFEKVFVDKDGTRRFKHLIEPYLTYRLIKGIGQDFDRIVLFDDRDAVANTSEFEYALVNRFYKTVTSSDLGRGKGRRRDGDDTGSEFEIERPDGRRRKKDGAPAPKPPGQAPDRAPEVGEKDKAAKLETGKSEELQSTNATRRDTAGRRDETPPREGAADAKPEGDGLSAEERIAQAATNEDAPDQSYEFLTIKVAQKIFFDRDFGGALQPGRRNQFFPINTLSGFTYGGRERTLSPTNVSVRYRPLALLFADVRMDLSTDDGFVRNLTLSTGFDRETYSFSLSWYLARRIDVAPGQFEAGSFPGNQVVGTFQFGDETRGWYAGTRIGYDFTDQVIGDAAVGNVSQISNRRLRNSRTYFGYAFDCCGVQFNYGTFKAGLRNESAFSFSFTLAGLGTFGTDQLSQIGSGGGNSQRRRAKRARRYGIY